MSKSMAKRLKAYVESNHSLEEELELLMLSTNVLTIDFLNHQIVKMVASSLKWTTYFKLLLLINSLLFEAEIERDVAS